MVKKKYNTKSITAIGDSLGGTLAEHATNRNDKIITNNKGISELERNDNYLFLIQSLNLVKIISNFNSQCLVVYFETLLVFLKINDDNDKNNISIIAIIVNIVNIVNIII